jgi:type II secretory pathway pseudopilin PulG
MKDIVVIILSLLTASFAFSFIVTLKQFRIAQATIEQLVLINEYLNKTTSLTEEQSDIHKENFIKFLSESRDWAFQYIDEVQVAIKEFCDTVGPDIEYFDEYGIVASSSPHYEALSKISKAYKQLASVLPEE